MCCMASLLWRAFTVACSPKSAILPSQRPGAPAHCKQTQRLTSLRSIMSCRHLVCKSVGRSIAGLQV